MPFVWLLFVYVKRAGVRETIGTIRRRMSCMDSRFVCTCTCVCVCVQACVCACVGGVFDAGRQCMSCMDPVLDLHAQMQAQRDGLAFMTDTGGQRAWVLTRRVAL